MEHTYRIADGQPALWGRQAARGKREEVEALLEAAAPGDVVVLDATGLEAFDTLFASEFFCRLMRELPQTYEGRFVVVDHLGEAARHNLETALTLGGLAMTERSKGGRLQLIGKLHPVDHETFGAIASGNGSVTAAELKEKLGTASVPTVNERLGKLATMGLVRRERAISPAGREQFVYSAPG